MGKAEETRKSIIEKSAVVFNKNGFQRTSMSTLTQALGLTKGAIYGHFTDKDELAVEAFRSSVERIRRRIGERISDHEGALGKLRAYAESFVVLFEETRNAGGCPRQHIVEEEVLHSVGIPGYEICRSRHESQVTAIGGE